MVDELLSDSEMNDLILDRAVEDVESRIQNVRNHPLLRDMLERPPESAFKEGDSTLDQKELNK